MDLNKWVKDEDNLAIGPFSTKDRIVKEVSSKFGSEKKGQDEQNDEKEGYYEDDLEPQAKISSH